MIYLLDIEGTTTSITFVLDVLFPYARQQLRSHLETHWEDSECVADVSLLKAESATDVGKYASAAKMENPDVDAVVAYVGDLMDENRKCNALKSLQVRWTVSIVSRQK